MKLASTETRPAPRARQDPGPRCALAATVERQQAAIRHERPSCSRTAPTKFPFLESSEIPTCRGPCAARLARRQQRRRQRRTPTTMSAATMQLSSRSSGICSTSYVCSTTSSRRRAVSVRAAEGFCRDKVNVDSKGKFVSQGKAFKLTFKGVGDQAVEVTCPDDTYILEAAEAAGLDLPATCKAGICGTCVGRVAEGTFDPSDIGDIEFTISADEQAQGLAMLCMTRPTSDCVIETQCDWGYSLGVKEWEGASGRFSAEPDPLMGSKWQQNAKDS